MILITKTCVCVCVCVVIPFFLDVRFLDVPAGATQDFLHLPPAMLALIFIARRIQPFLSLVDREVELCVRTKQSSSTCWAFLRLPFPTPPLSTIGTIGME